LICCLLASFPFGISCNVFPHSDSFIDRDEKIVRPHVPLSQIWRTMPKFHIRKLRHLAPIITWLPLYKWRENWMPDLISGLTVGVMSIPQGI
jgi:hypothetical protein